MSDYKEKSSDQRTPPSKWLKLFLTINLAFLIGLFIWEATGPVRLGEEKLKEVQVRQIEDISAAIAKNPDVTDFTGKLGDKMLFTLDATDSGAWVHFKLSNATSFKRAEFAKNSLDWDIAFRRAKIITNGGETNKKGMAAVALMDTADFDSVVSVPDEELFMKDNTDDNLYEPKNPAIDKWYEYDFWTHRLKPKKNVFVIRTADGRYAKFKILNYYCGTAAGCYTLLYMYQGKDSHTFTQ